MAQDFPAGKRSSRPQMPGAPGTTYTEDAYDAAPSLAIQQPTGPGLEYRPIQADTGALGGGVSNKPYVSGQDRSGAVGTDGLVNDMTSLNVAGHQQAQGQHGTDRTGIAGMVADVKDKILAGSPQDTVTRSHGTHGLSAGSDMVGNTSSSVATQEQSTDPAHAYDPDHPNAEKVVRHVAGEKQVIYEPVRVETTIVYHDVEVIRPVLHQEVHVTRVHEVDRYSDDPTRIQGGTQVVRHADAGQYGQGLTANTGGYSTSDVNVSSNAGGYGNSYATGGVTTTQTTETSRTGGLVGGSSDTHYDSSHYDSSHAIKKKGVMERIKDSVTGNTSSSTVTTSDGYRTDNIAVTDNADARHRNELGSKPASHEKKPGAIKKLINKVLPGH